MRSMSNGNIIIVNREYIRDIGGDTAFTNDPYAINPGSARTFPWLSQIADSYEEYRIRGIVFQFKSTSSPYTINQKSPSIGTVIMAAQYNVNNPIFTNKRDMENYIGAQSASVLQDQLFSIKPDTDPLKVLYIRQGIPTEQNYDLRMYDFARFELATIGVNVDPAFTVSNQVGELWVSYEIELIKPRLRDTTGLMDHYMLTPSALTGVTTALPFGTNTINRTSPTPSNNSWKNNGYFQLFTEIVAGTKSRLSFSDSLANQTFKLTIALWNAANTPVTAAATDVQDMTLTLDPEFGVVQPANKGPFWARTGLNVTSSAPSGGGGTLTVSGGKYIWCWIITFSTLNARSTGYMELEFTKAPANMTSWYYDVILERVNLTGYNIRAQ
ncbi:capsid protein [Crucivirus-501]|nr:capsid protein [Crucivirus-501]QMW68998.1 capsid protein [Crucivirus-509]